MTVALGPHVGTVLFDGVTSCRNFAGVPLVHFPAEMNEQKRTLKKKLWEKIKGMGAHQKKVAK